MQENSTAFINVSLLYDLKKGTRAKRTNNHDDPGFSNPGEDPQVENLQVFYGDKNITSFITKEDIERFENEIIEDYFLDL